MKRIALIFVLASAFFLNTASPASAAFGFFRPDSRMYFFQPAIESVRLLFTFSKEAKTDYLLQLTERRVDEMAIEPRAATADRYQAHFEELEKLAGGAKDKEQVVEKLKEASLRQQEVLSAVYARVSDEAKDAILNAQENSSKNVERTIEAVEGADKAREYAGRVEEMQRVQKMERAGRLEQAPMEGTPNANPSESVPQELREGKGLLPGKEMNPLNPVLDEQGGSGGEGIEPAAPVPMQQPAPRR